MITIVMNTSIRHVNRVLITRAQTAPFIYAPRSIVQRKPVSRTKSFARESRGKWQVMVEQFPWIRQETRHDTNRSSNGLELGSSRYSNRTMRVLFFFLFFFTNVRQRTPQRIKGKRDKTCSPRPSNRSILDRVAVNDGRRARVDRVFAVQ